MPFRSLSASYAAFRPRDKRRHGRGAQKLVAIIHYLADHDFSLVWRGVDPGREKVMPAKTKPPHPQEAVGLDVLEDTLSFYIRSINMALSRDLDKSLEGLDVAKGTGKITTLLLVDSHPGIRPSVIAQLILRDRSAMGRVVDQMITHGLLTRQTDSSDGRAQALHITPKGAEMAKRVRKVAVEQSRDFFYDVSEEDQKRLLSILRRVYRRTVGLTDERS
ncbi:MAG: MarR family winged helix-turn-helix transcriptional regulator [Rhizobiaceae bacterium]